MPKLRDLTGTELGWLFLPFIGLFALGVGLRYLYPDTAWGHEIVHLSGDAFAVAGVLGFVVELFVTGRLIDHTAKSLSDRLIGWGLPAELQGEIRKIVETRLVRFNTLKQYSIHSPRDGKVTVEIKYSWDVRNYGDVSESYAPWMAEEEFYQPEFVYLEYGIIGESGHTYEGEALQSLVTVRARDNVRDIYGPEKITLNPYRTHPESVCRVVCQYRVTMPENYTDATAFGGAAIGMRVQVDSVPDGFEFVGDSRNAVRSGRTWTYTGPFIQHQHIRVRWFRRGG